MSLFRRRRTDAALIAKLAADNTNLRHALAELGKQLHEAQGAAIADTLPMPRVRSHAAPAGDQSAAL